MDFFSSFLPSTQAFDLIEKLNHYSFNLTENLKIMDTWYREKSTLELFCVEIADILVLTLEKSKI